MQNLMDNLWFYMFLYVLPITIFFSIVPLDISRLFGKKSREAIIVLSFGFIGAIIGYFSWIIYYKLTGIEQNSPIYNLAIGGLFCISGYTMAFASFVIWLMKIKDERKKSRDNESKTLAQLNSINKIIKNG